MTALVLCAGRIKEKWLKDGISEYQKRLSRLVKTDIQEVDDLPEPENSSTEACRQANHAALIIPAFTVPLSS